MARVITLTTDFGPADGFPAAMKGVILGISPGAQVVDITHDVPPQGIAHASFVLGAVAPYFPAGSIHVAVVDPGVGTARAALVVRAPDGTLYVGPDDGVFSHVLSAEGPLPWASHGRPFLSPGRGPLPSGFCAWRIESPAFMREEVSRTFHGRDVFAPAAAHLAEGVPPDGMGPGVTEVSCLNLPGPREEGGRLAGHVQHVDRFGNLVTDIPGSRVLQAFRSLEVGGRVIRRLSASYRDAGELGCVVGSHGYLEIASFGQDAAEALGCGVGDEVVVE
ncbi:MAG: SAM-dependent chlorinase/fluorinase [Gemmatimonadetes bacterium]|nr:SAM-dependent chlorinase/fluorinase [Gemmatimonadota bacterium]